MKAQYSLDVRRMSKAKIQNLITEYTSLGWELAGGFSLGENNFHQFLTFVWNKESEPVYPNSK